jgi:hypothetical protein
MGSGSHWDENMSDDLTLIFFTQTQGCRSKYARVALAKSSAVTALDTLTVLSAFFCVTLIRSKNWGQVFRYRIPHKEELLDVM